MIRSSAKKRSLEAAPEEETDLDLNKRTRLATAMAPPQQEDLESNAIIREMRLMEGRLRKDVKDGTARALGEVKKLERRVEKGEDLKGDR